MSAKPPAIAEDAQAGADAAPAKPKAAKRKMIVIAGAAAALLIGGGGGAYAFLGGSGKAEAKAGHEGGETAASTDEEGGGAHAEESGAEFVDVPAMVVNLRSADGGARFIKLHFMLVPGPKGDPETLKEKLPLLLDAYQPFLRELRPEDLAGSAAVFRIKEEMLLRATDTLGAGQVKDVLIQDLIQQ